jgi:hypothetical protein
MLEQHPDHYIEGSPGDVRGCEREPRQRSENQGLKGRVGIYYKSDPSQEWSFNSGLRSEVIKFRGISLPDNQPTRVEANKVQSPSAGVGGGEEDDAKQQQTG